MITLKVSQIKIMAYWNWLKRMTKKYWIILYTFDLVQNMDWKISSVFNLNVLSPWELDKDGAFCLEQIIEAANRQKSNCAATHLPSYKSSK